MASIVNITTTNGVTYSSDNTGILQIQVNGTLVGTFQSSGLTLVNPLPAGQSIVKTAVITFTRVMSVASGSVAYTGVGFKPSTVVFVAGGGSVNYGVSVSDSAFGAGGVYDTGNGLTVAGIVSGSSGAYQSGVITSYDSDGFTINWTKVGSPGGTGTFYALCFR
jgi:hypothetical protein